MVASQKFSLKSGENKKDYLFIVANSLAGVEADIYELIKVLISLLLGTMVLLVIAQLLFSWWVVAPIKKLEKEVLAITSGKKAFLENDYPSELQTIQHAINALINGNKQK